jgi:hypothetical protein
MTCVSLLRALENASGRPRRPDNFLGGIWVFFRDVGGWDRKVTGYWEKSRQTMPDFMKSFSNIPSSVPHLSKGLMPLLATMEEFGLPIYKDAGRRRRSRRVVLQLPLGGLACIAMLSATVG